MTIAPTLELNDGNRMPAVGLGTWPLTDAEAERAVGSAIDLGYRLIDTATRYDNEVGVGRALAATDVPREELFVTTKLPGADQGYDATLQSFEAARRRLGLEYVDLYLVHWPLPRVDRYVDSFRAMVRLRDDGLIRSVGVSNFTAGHLTRLRDETGVVPAVNQIECHPRFNQRRMQAVHRDLGVVTQAWSPLGEGGELLTDARVTRIARELDVTAGQVVLRWEVQSGMVPIPKSADRGRQASNLDVFSFALSPEQMAVLSDMETGRLGGDPDSYEEF